MLKKITGLLMICAIVVGLSSCCKDGVYVPKQQISKVYVQAAGASKSLSEEWIWNGDNLVQINFHRTIGKDYIVSFQYDGNKIIKMTSTEGEETSFTYDGAKLISAETKEGSKTVSTMRFEHDGRYISEIKVNVESGLKNRIMEQTFLRLITNDNVPAVVEKQLAECQVKGTISYELDFDYENGNVSVIEFSMNGGDEQKITYTYNKDYKNPFHHFLYDDTDYSSLLNYSFDFNLSKNMPANQVVVDKNGKTTWEIEYTYEGKKYPTKETRSQTYNYTNGNSTTNALTYYYEYK